MRWWSTRGVWRVLCLQQDQLHYGLAVLAGSKCAPLLVALLRMQRDCAAAAADCAAPPARCAAARTLRRGRGNATNRHGRGSPRKDSRSGSRCWRSLLSAALPSRVARCKCRAHAVPQLHE
jgi:hypothetical protein